MSHIVTPTVIQNGSKNIVLHFYFESDGVEGEFNNRVLLDPVTMYTEFDLPRDQALVRPVLSQIWHSFSAFDGLLSFDLPSPVPVWSLCQGNQGYTDFRYFGGLPERQIPPSDMSSTDRTGRILFTTKGFGPIGSWGTLVLEIRKNVG